MLYIIFKKIFPYYEYKGFKWYFKKSKIKIKNKTPLIEYFKNENYLNLPLIKGNKVPFLDFDKRNKKFNRNFN